jgi:hypothetical protein
MVWPVAFPLEAFLTRAGITALGTAATSEGIKSLQNQGTVNPGVAKEAFMRTLMGPTTEILNRTTDTPSGKVFAPTGEVIEPNQIPGIAPPEQQQGITGLPIPEKVPGLPGLINPEQVDTSILNKEKPTENVSTQDLTVENIQNKIKYKKSKFDKNITEAYLGDKKIAEIEKDTDSKKTGNQFDYTINWTNEKGEIDYDNYDRETGFNSAKYTTALGLINTIKSQEKEYLNKFIKAVENKDYDTLNKIREEERGYDFEDSEFRSKEFKDTIDKYRPDLIKLSTEAYNEQQEAIKETLNKPGSPVENLTEDQNLFNENALAKQDDQAYQVNMTPDQYLSLTRKIESGDLENTKERTQRIKDAIKKGGKIENYPYLYIKKEGDNFLVTGEEGRHRALVLKELGVKQMPVMIRGIGSAKDGIENKRYTTPATGYAATDPYLKKFAGYKPKLIISDKTAEKPFQISWENLTTELKPTEKNTSKSAGSLIDKPLSDE